ncbi:cholesteryl ester transfer protein isoform X2 [Varanus komodoensis]|uniref:cholesteryl ester transfer protein isoform X2 n=1 Tax=Varanus komodoensis TaxID=61221 RepID=UPI001CF7C1EA|nr:cholesteryl ester transfer protein isoform X2 [Varanus komodoensis]
MTRILGLLIALLGRCLACCFDSPSFGHTGIVSRVTKKAALILNTETAGVIQAAFRNADYPDIKGEKSMHLLGKVAYGLTNIHVNDLSIQNTEVDLREDQAIDLAIQNVSASFNGTLSYGYVATWLAELIHYIDFEIESSIDLQISFKLICRKERLAVDLLDCSLTFHKLNLHLQRDKEPGWLKQVFTNFISFTLKLILQSRVCKEINSISQLLTESVQDQAAQFLEDGDIAVDLSPSLYPVIKANYLESYHKGLLLYKNYSDVLQGSPFTPALLPESQMLYFWFAEHVIQSLAIVSFLDQRLALNITGEKLKEIFESEELKTHQDTVQKIFQGTSYGDCVAKVWSLVIPQITFEPEGTVVKSSVAVELTASSLEEEPSMVLYFETDAAVTVQASYVEKKLLLNLSHATAQLRTTKGPPTLAVDNETLRHILEKIILASGIPEVVSRIESALNSLLDRREFYLYDISNVAIITQRGYLIVQLDFAFPRHLLFKFLKGII